MVSIADKPDAKGIDDALSAGVRTEVLTGADAVRAARETAAAAGVLQAAPAKQHAADDAAKRKAGNRFQILNAFTDRRMGQLSRSEIAAWLVLYRDTKPDGVARTSQADLARRAGMDERSVRRAITSLKRRGLVKVIHRGGLRSGPSIYAVSP